MAARADRPSRRALDLPAQSAPAPRTPTSAVEPTPCVLTTVSSPALGKYPTLSLRKHSCPFIATASCRDSALVFGGRFGAAPCAGDGPRRALARTHLPSYGGAPQKPPTALAQESRQGGRSDPRADECPGPGAHTSPRSPTPLPHSAAGSAPRPAPRPPSAATAGPRFPNSPRGGGAAGPHLSPRSRIVQTGGARRARASVRDIVLCEVWVR